ncbi:hypothetical protein EPR50_G00115390 [Perca flavescens]|uniref:Uncharacterized protein n=1 Tax=Perca flavescens TaxID=8167 RepID=A0A484CS49_PERFV|nr:hypothetical protein EPR50_G00115390 [Perca flavescens]
MTSTMISALMAWVCICLTLARLNNAGGHRDAHGRLAGQGELSDGNKQQFEAGPEDAADRSTPAPVWGFLKAQLNNAGSHRHARGRLAGQGELSDGNKQQFEAGPEDAADRSTPAPVWRFLQGTGKTPEISDFNQPQFRCSNGTLTLRFSPTRYTNLNLEDGTPLLSLPDRCHGSIHVYRQYLLVKLPYTGCYTATQAEEGKLQLHYFDNLLQKNMVGMAVCENPGMSPLVTCGTTSVTVKLPCETKLKEVKELDYFVNEAYSVRQQKTPNALFVEISKLPDQDSGFEIVYLDSTGKLCTKLAICYQEKLSHRVKRALEEPDFEETPVEQFDLVHSRKDTGLKDTGLKDTGLKDTGLKDTQLIQSMATKANSETVGEGDSKELFELWGIEDIPDEAYDEITTPTAPTITTTNSTKSTVASATSCP